MMNDVTAIQKNADSRVEDLEADLAKTKSARAEAEVHKYTAVK